MKVLIADDHVLFRDGLKKIISERIDDVIYGEAENLSELMNLVSKESWDIILLDLSMPGRSGIDALKDIKSFYPKIPVLILSMYPESQFATRVIKLGASGYLTKDSKPEILIDAIKEISKGKKYFTSTVAEIIAEDLQSDGNNPIKKLTDREYQILLKIASGHSLTKIANDLSLSVKTIGTHRANILRKLKLKNNAEIVKYAIENNLIGLS